MNGTAQFFYHDNIVNILLFLIIISLLLLIQIAKVLQDPQNLKNLKETFKMFDEDGSGHLDLEELKRFVKARQES